MTMKTATFAGHNNRKHRIDPDGWAVDARFAVEIAWNGDNTDACQRILLAPVVTRGESGVIAAYLTTNGAPVNLLTLDHDNDVVWRIGEDYADEYPGNEVTLKMCLADFDGFAGMSSQECADEIKQMWGCAINA